MNQYVIIAIIFAVLMTIFWVFMFIFGKKGDIILEVVEEGKSKPKTLMGKTVIDPIAKTKKIEIQDKSKIHITYWNEYFEDIGKKQPRLRLYKDINGMYHPRRVVFNQTDNELQEITDFKDMLFWHTLETREGDEKYKLKKKLIEQLTPIIGFIIVGLLIFLAVYFIMDATNKHRADVMAYEMKTLDLRVQEVQTLNESTMILRELKPILEDLAKARKNQIVGVVNG